MKRFVLIGSIFIGLLATGAMAGESQTGRPSLLKELKNVVTALRTNAKVNQATVIQVKSDLDVQWARVTTLPKSVRAFMRDRLNMGSREMSQAETQAAQRKEELARLEKAMRNAFPLGWACKYDFVANDRARIENILSKVDADSLRAVQGTWPEEIKNYHVAMLVPATDSICNGKESLAYVAGWMPTNTSYAVVALWESDDSGDTSIPFHD